MDYYIVSAENQYKLMDSVNGFLCRGYRLIGGPLIDKSGWWHQAVQKGK